MINLNPEQQKAVDAIYGPVLLLAGPGSGKTRVLTLRIANILKKTDTNPQDILALTFTENAAAEMRSRLIEIIGTEAHDLNIQTFHAFANEIILTYPEKFIFSSRLSQIDDISRLKIVKNIIDKSKFKRLSPHLSPYMFLSNIIQNISTLKREGFSAERFSELIQEEKKCDTEDMKKAERVKFEKNLERWEELALAYGLYDKEMREKGFYDYEDMILFVVEKLKADDELRAEIQEKFQFFLIDEFQDTNGAQLELVRNIAEKEKPNVFAVGDADQSIYRFQGASMENVLLFEKYFQGAQTLSLNTNYRSTKEIVDTANLLIENNENRLNKGALVSAIGESTEKPIFTQTKSEEDELFFLLKNIKGSLQDKKNQHEALLASNSHNFPQSELSLPPLDKPVLKYGLIGSAKQNSSYSYSDNMILVRTNAEARKIFDFLEENDIPCNFGGKINALNCARVEQFLSILSLIKNPQNNSLFFKVLNYDFIKIPASEIWNIWDIIKENQTNFWAYFISEEREGEIADFTEMIKEFQYDAENLALDAFLKKLLSQSGLLDFLLEDKLNIDELNHINALFDEAQNAHNLEEFLENIAIRKEFNIALTEKAFYAEKDAVRIMTAHGAKGLEAERVFIPNLSRGNWGDKRGGRGMSLPEGIVQNPSEDKNEDERRLFFVAITRAKKQLFLSCSEEKTQSRFLEEIEGLLKNQQYEEENLKKKISAHLTYKEKDTEYKSWERVKSYVSSENFALSHNLVENYMLCPRKCLYSNVLHVPQEKSNFLVLGSAIHKGLEVFFQSGGKDSAVATQTFVNYVNKQKMEQKEKELILNKGKILLEEYLVYKDGNFGLLMGTEVNFRSHNIRLDNEIPLTGKIDKIEFMDEGKRAVRIIDFKVSTPKSENVIRGTTKSEKDKPGAGVNYRQMIFYAILAQESKNFPYSAESFELHFLRPDSTNGKYIERAFLPSDEEISAHKEAIREAWQGIQALEFPRLDESEKKKKCALAGGGGEKCPFWGLCWG